MSLIANCLEKLVKQGKVSQGQADAAQRLHEGMQGRLFGEMPGSSADAYAALEAARIMAEGARARKLSIAKQAIASDAAMQRVAAHPKGKAAGLMAEMVTDIREAQKGADIESYSESVAGRLMAKFKDGAEVLRSRYGGFVQDRALGERVVRELFGADTGDEAAKKAAQGFTAASDYGVMRAKAGGKIFNELDEWHLPQFWASSRVVQAGEAEFVNRVIAHVDARALRVMNKNTGGPALPGEIPFIVKAAFEDITTGAGRGSGGTFNPEMRIFRFADGEPGAAAWLDLQRDFGPGQDVYGLLTGHLQSMARDLAFTDQWGPNYRATFHELIGTVQRDEKRGIKASVFIRWMESAAAAERTFRVLTGEANEIASDLSAGIMGGLRSWQASSQLGSALIPSVFGDPVTSALAAHYNGIGMGKVVGKTIELLAKEGPALRADLARLNIIAHTVMDSAIGSARYADDSFTGSISAAFRGQPRGATAARRASEITGGMANAVIRMQGLQAWTQAMRRSFTMEMLSYTASQQGHRFDALDEPFRNFLTRRGITRAEWDKLRDVPPLVLDVDGDGVRFFDIEAVPDARLGDKLMAGIVSERRYAVLEPSARIQQFTTQGLARGTFMGEVARSASAYKAFPLAMLVFHGSRAWMQSPMTRAGYIGALSLLWTTAGALTIQTKALLTGRDPRPMDRWEFWAASFVAGGGGGIFGDLLYEGFTRGGGGLVATAVGPLGSLVESAGRLVFPTTRKALEGEPVGFGAELARFMRWNMPGTNLWYSRLALDRLLWDQVQTMVDPDYRKSFRRMEQRARRDYGQDFWWRPGQATPRRAPDLGAVLQ